jgi:ABC-2 type transport system permease protein
MNSTSQRSIWLELHRLFWRLQVTRLRLFGLLALGSVTILLALIARNADDVSGAAFNTISGYGLGIAGAIAALWVASSTLGDLVDDQLMVYLWIKPTQRWLLPFAALTASISVLAIVVLMPVGVAAMVTGVGGIVGATIAAVLLSTAAYSSLFVAFGLTFRRSLFWGLVYVLIWENLIAGASSGTARLSILSYGQSIIGRAIDVEPSNGLRSPLASWLVPIAITVLGVVFATRRLDRAEID